MDQKKNYLSLILLDALEDESESDINFILDRNKKCIDPSYVPQDRGIAPLHYACGMEKDKMAIDVIKRFLEMGANPNCKTEDDITPLHVAAIYGRVEIVRLLLQHGAELEVYDNEGKSPLKYAIENDFFEVVKVLRDHIFLKKLEIKNNAILNNLLSESKFERSLQAKDLDKQSTPQRTTTNKTRMPQRNAPENLHINLLKANSHNETINNNSLNGLNTTESGGGGEQNKFTPNRINYNYDVTSPYYINITHRRHRPQPKFPNLQNTETFKECKTIKTDVITNELVDDILSISMQRAKLSSPEHEEEYSESVNIFALTQENLKELTQSAGHCSKSRFSLIESWRDKVQRSRPRPFDMKLQFDDINEMIDLVVENDHLNFNNVQLVEEDNKQKLNKNTEIDSGAACGSTTASIVDETEYFQLPNEITAIENDVKKNQEIDEQKTNEKIIDDKTPMTESKTLESKVPPNQAIELDSSFVTVPEIILPSASDDNNDLNSSTNFIRSPKDNEYFLQMAEAYVHTDDENGLVFFETKLLSNVGNMVARQRLCTPKALDLDTTSTTSESTNITLPMDYETDTLRAELTIFGNPPGPITKTTKRLYLKRLMKYKRKTDMIEEFKMKNKEAENKFSVELRRTIKSEENFLRIQDFSKYETQSMQFFVNNENKREMREGHLKQSFIYMLIDPRISCNLAGESVFLEKFEVWQRFLHSIFYVGKGKTSRPYSHLYDAMKAHTRFHNKDIQEKINKAGKKTSIKKQPLNVDIFKSPPQKSSDSKKLDRILDIWGNGYGVVCLHVFHNIVPSEAYTREAAIIDALSLQHLTNCKRGNYYGPAKTWTMKEKKYLGIALLFKAMHIYLAEGESQLSPGDLV